MLSKEFYFQSLELSKSIFYNSWQLVADAEDIKLDNSIFPFTLLKDYLNESLLLTKYNNQVNCISNVCTHRASTLVDHPCNNKKSIRCPYHGRKFTLDGKFESMPEFQGVEITEKDNLKQFQTLSWHNLIFVSLDNTNNYLKDMISRVSWFDFSELKKETKYSREYLVKAHWALYCDNYLEGFHIPYVHHELNEALDYQNYSTEIFEKSVLQLGVARNQYECFNLPKDSVDYGKNISAYYFWIFPNMMFNFYTWGLSINIVKPISPELTKIQYIVYTNNQFKETDITSLDRVEREDEVIVEKVQQGLKSKFYEPRNLSPTKEQGVKHFHAILNSLI